MAISRQLYLPEQSLPHEQRPLVWARGGFT
jgi:hypothetical protein